MQPAADYGFYGKLEADANGCVLLHIPPIVSQWMGKRGHVLVVGEIDGFPIRASFLPLGDGTHCMMVGRPTLDALGVDIGDVVRMEFCIETSVNASTFAMSVGGRL